MRLLTPALLAAALWVAWPAVSQAQVVSDDQFIRSLYKEYLNRTPSRSEVGYWVGIMRERGSTRHNVRLTFLATEEFFNLHKRDRARTMRALYRHLLGREATRAEVNTWVDRWREYFEDDRSALVTDFYDNAVRPEKEGG